MWLESMMVPLDHLIVRYGNLASSFGTQHGRTVMFTKPTIHGQVSHRLGLGVEFDRMTCGAACPAIKVDGCETISTRIWSIWNVHTSCGHQLSSDHGPMTMMRLIRPAAHIPIISTHQKLGSHSPSSVIIPNFYGKPHVI